MKFLIDYNKKIIVGWSAKCGCSHVKNIFWFLQNNLENNLIHTDLDSNNLPDDIENYTTIVISRNPYKRIVSGFLDKYMKNSEYKILWKHNNITFSMFVNELIKNNWEMVNKHHFTQQTSEKFSLKILQSKNIKFYDIENIDYNYIEDLYNIKIPDKVMNKKEGHERINRIKKDKIFNNYVYDLEMDEYHDSNVDIKFFYNEELKNKIYKFYEYDFNFFEEVGINYKIQYF